MSTSAFIIILGMVGGVWIGTIQPLTAVVAGILIICSNKLFLKVSELPEDRGTAVGCIATIMGLVGILVYIGLYKLEIEIMVSYWTK